MSQHDDAISTNRLKPPLWHRARYALSALGLSLREGLLLVKPVESVLDYGCGAKPYRDLFEPTVHYQGADYANTAGADIHLLPDGQLPVEDGCFDVVLSTQVLEHVAEPTAYLAKARRVLRPGGALLLSTHGVWPYHPHPDDFWRWTASGLRRIVEKAGFTVIAIYGIMGPASAGLQLWQDAVWMRLPNTLRAPFAFLMQSVIRLHDRMTSVEARSRDAAIYVVVARVIGGKESV